MPIPSRNDKQEKYFRPNSSIKLLNREKELSAMISLITDHFKEIYIILLAIRLQALKLLVLPYFSPR